MLEEFADMLGYTSIPVMVAEKMGFSFILGLSFIIPKFEIYGIGNRRLKKNKNTHFYLLNYIIFLRIIQFPLQF